MNIHSFPNDVSNFLNALFGSYEGELRFDLNEEVICSGDLEFIQNNASELRVFSTTSDGVFFIYQYNDDISKARLFVKPPTVTVMKDSASIDCWAFVEPISNDDKRLIELMKTYDIDTAVPLPGVDGWNMAVCNEDAVYTLADMLGEKAEEPVELEKYADAVIYNSYKETDYEREFIVTFGGRRESQKWTPKTGPLAALIAKLCQHKVGAKDGESVVFADMHPGQRLKNAVKSVTGIGLDIDTGTPTEEIDAAIDGLKCVAVRYTTHSHNKTVSEFKKDNVIRFDPDAGEITTELMQRFCATKEKWHQSIVDSIEYLEEDHTEKGIIVRIKHAPMPKNRIFVPMRDPYEIAKEGKTQIEAMAKWAKIPEALASLLKVPFDRSCTDPSRLFYLPRHDKGKDFSITLFGGPLFDRAALQLDDVFDELIAELNKKGGKSKTLEGKKLGKWSMRTAHGFQIANVLEDHCPDRLRGPASSGFNICCPFDDEHSNPGDTSDRACFAVNAADGGNELFIINCRHETCRDKTNLDMLGRMIKDGWFDRSVIDDPVYNIVDDGDGNLPSAPTLGDIEKLIDKVPNPARKEDLLPSLKAIAKANFSPADRDDALALLVEKSGRKLRVLQGELAIVQKEFVSKPSEQSFEASGKIASAIFERSGTPFDFPPEHFGECFLGYLGGRPWLYQNHKEGVGEAIMTPSC